MKARSFPRRFILSLSCLALFTVSATAVTVTATPSKDNSMFADSPTHSNGEGAWLFAGETALGFPRRALIAFDLSVVPTGATIVSAQVQLTVSKAQGANNSMKLHRVTQPWGEGLSNSGTPGGLGAPAETGDATWTYRFYDTTSWTASGGDYLGTNSASASVSGDGTYTWTSSELASDVQGWVNNPATNNGWILIGDETRTLTAKRIHSSESPTASLRPKLLITYNPAVIASTPFVLTGPTRLGKGSFPFGFTNLTGANFTVLASANVALPLTNWTVLGAPLEAAPGTYQFTDPQATNNVQRFYRVRSP